MNILLIAGHGNGDPGACGCGYQEANETRRMMEAVAVRLSKLGISVVKFDETKNAYDVVRLGGALPLNDIDYVVEFHLNAGVGDQTGNGATTGTEVLVHASEPATTVEQCILDNICAIGFKNRGVKRRNDLAVMGYVVSSGISHALIETCFIDDKDDMDLYERKFDEIADAIADGIMDGFGLDGQNQKPSEWAKEAVAEAIKMGITDGSRPHDPATREEVACMIMRAMKK